MTKFELVKKQLKDAMKTEVKLKKLQDVSIKPEDNITINAGLRFAQDLKRAMRAIISMFPELNKKKTDIVDKDIEYLCKKIIKNEKTRLLYQNKHLVAKDVEGLTHKQANKLENEKLVEFDDVLTSQFIVIFEEFLPKMATKEEICNFINKNVDFSKLKNKMQAIGIVKNHFGNGVDANLVKEIIQSWN